MIPVKVRYFVYRLYNVDEDTEFRLPVAEIHADNPKDLTDDQRVWGGQIDMLGGYDFRDVRRDVFEKYGKHVLREEVYDQEPCKLTEDEWQSFLCSMAMNDDKKGSHERTFRIYR